MLKFQHTLILSIFGATACLASMSYIGDVAAQSMMPVDTYGAAPYQSTSPQSLGTLHRSDMAAPQSGYAAPGQAATNSGDDILQPMQAGDITYITGGIGDEERDTLHEMAKNYNLRVMSASTDGSFTGEVHLLLLNAKGTTLLDTEMGPLFFAQLHPGTYKLQATRGAQTKEKKIVVGHGKTSLVHFSW